MSHEDVDPRIAEDRSSTSSRKLERDDLADRAAEAAATLYVTLEHEERRRRFDTALARAHGVQ